MRKVTLFLLFLFLTVKGFSQQQLNFSFAENPQTLMLNPGAETNYKYHYGIPMLSGINFSIGSTQPTLKDFFENNIPFQNRLQRVIDNVERGDYINVTTKIDVLNGGYRLNERDYLSFGFYQELDIISYAPKDVLDLMFYGNVGFLNRSFSLSQVVAKGEILGVLHLGISRKISNRLNVGARVKIYSSSFHAETSNNTGTFTTYQDNTNIIRQNLNSVNFLFQTSGLMDGRKITKDFTSLYTRTLMGGNYGLGFDIGMTYHFSPQLEFTASILDIGFIKHKKNNRVYRASGDYTFDGINFQYASNTDYWDNLSEDISDNLPSEETDEGFTSWRPAKINAALKYSFGQIRSHNCYADTHKKYYYNAIGLQLHNVMRPLKPQFALTAFYEKSFSEKINTKYTYTINDYSKAILGLGASMQFGKVNIFGFLDNIFAVPDLATASNISLSMGVSMVIN